MVRSSTRARRKAEAEAFAERLREVLAAHGQPRRGAGAYLAGRYGVSRVTANAWLNGLRRPDLHCVALIARDHGVPLDALYFGSTLGGTLTEQEVALLTAYRTAGEVGQRRIAALVGAVLRSSGH